MNIIRTICGAANVAVAARGAFAWMEHLNRLIALASEQPCGLWPVACNSYKCHSSRCVGSLTHDVKRLTNVPCECMVTGDWSRHFVSFRNWIVDYADFSIWFLFQRKEIEWSEHFWLRKIAPEHDQLITYHKGWVRNVAHKIRIRKKKKCVEWRGAVALINQFGPCSTKLMDMKLPINSFETVRRNVCSNHFRHSIVFTFVGCHSFACKRCRVWFDAVPRIYALCAFGLRPSFRTDNILILSGITYRRSHNLYCCAAWSKDDE